MHARVTERYTYSESKIQSQVFPVDSNSWRVSLENVLNFSMYYCSMKKYSPLAINL